MSSLIHVLTPKGDGMRVPFDAGSWSCVAHVSFRPKKGTPVAADFDCTIILTFLLF